MTSSDLLSDWYGIDRQGYSVCRRDIQPTLHSLMMVSFIGMSLASGPYIGTRGQFAQAGCRHIVFVDVMPTCMNGVNCGSCEALQGYSNPN